MKITKDKLTPGMIIYSSPEDFASPEKKDFEWAAIDVHGEIKLTPTTVSKARNTEYGHYWLLKNIEFVYTTWKAALIASKESAVAQLNEKAADLKILQELIDAI